MITFSYSLHLDQARQNVGTYLCPNCLTLIAFEKNQQTTKKACKITQSSIRVRYSFLPHFQPNGNGFLDGQGLVTLRMIPDEQGRFGFNVKGGADQGMPIIVSRVAPNTPADNCIPRLNEGDQVLFINGRDVSQHTHEQVVSIN